MNNKYFYFLTLFCALSIIPCFSIKAQEVWDLKKCIETARTNNNELKNLKTNISKAEVNHKSAKYNFYPDLEAAFKSGNNYGLLIDPTTNTLFFGNTFINSFQINSKYNLFNGFYNQYTKSLTDNQITYAQHLFDKRFYEIVLEITYFYYQALFAQENRILLIKSLDNFQKRKKFIEASIKTEILHKRHIYNIEYLIAQTEADMINCENNAQQFKAQLMILSGLNIQDTFNLYSLPLTQEEVKIFDYNTIIEQVKHNFPDLKAGAAQIQNAEWSYKQAGALAFPELLLEGQLGTKTSTNKTNENFTTQFNNNKNQYIGLSLNIPIFKNYNIKQAKEISLLDVEIAHNNARDLMLKVENNVYQAVMEYNNALKLHSALLKQFEAVQEEYMYAEKLFDVGNLGIFEFTDVSERFLETERNLLNAQFDMLLKRKIVELYTGELFN